MNIFYWVIILNLEEFGEQKDILNICLTLLITINLALEFEGQSSDFAFLTDTGLFLCCFCVLIFTIVIKIKH